MTETDKAYLAGLIDGEGTITLTRSNRDQLPQPQVSIANNSLNLLKWVQLKLGFGCIRARKPRKATHKTAYVWQVNRAGRCRQILCIVYPFLILKKQQAEIILNEYPLATPRNGKYSADILNKKLHIVKKIQAMNQGESILPIIRQASKR